MDDSGFRPVTRSATTTRTSALKTRIQKRKPLSELPSHLQSAGYTFVVQNNNSVVTVDRRGHTFIAKKVPRDSPELDILKRCKKRSVPNTIRFTDIIVKPKSPSYVILPRLSVLGADLVIGGAIDRVRPHLPTMTYDLARGLAHLHRLRIAHLDVKPNNLVYDQHFTLYLIDFDHAVQLRSGEDMIKGRAGTPGWSAPEVNSGKAYDPIMADRYSCGLVFNLFRGLARLDPHLDHELNDFSLRLRSRKPTARPSLTTWVPSSDA
ncbi:kinase-like domain-containing protein [Rhodocollybia butyracea]|nr:kinase-like domain-containing protein [Rhodocollybia butyracea]